MEWIVNQIFHLWLECILFPPDMTLHGWLDVKHQVSIFFSYKLNSVIKLKRNYILCTFLLFTNLSQKWSDWLTSHIVRARSNCTVCLSWLHWRMTMQFADIAVDAMCRGIFANDCRQLSMRSCFPEIFDLERRHGSLTMAMLRSRGERMFLMPGLPVCAWICSQPWVFITACLKFIVLVNVAVKC